MRIGSLNVKRSIVASLGKNPVDSAAKAKKLGADIAKFAVMPRSYEDVLRLLNVTLHAEGAVCTIAMGETGRHRALLLPFMVL